MTTSAELIARTVSPDGLESYRATLIVKAGSGITLESVMACGRRYSFGIGDAQSTSGTRKPGSAPGRSPNSAMP